MWIEFSKLVLCLYFCSSVANGYTSKLDYIKRRERYHEKNAVSDSSYNYKVSKSRYPNLEKVKTRIENMNNEPPATESRSLVRIRHKGWSNYRPIATTTTTTTTENGLFETYSDLDDDGDFDDYDSSMEDEDDELDYDDESESFFDEVQDVQAEEPTERPTAAPRPVSSLTDYKWQHYGRSSDVAESRRNYLAGNGESGEPKLKNVIAHSMRVNQQGKCSSPSPKVIPVQREHPDPTKSYTPHCTVLHRCGEDTGCCKYDTTCQYKRRVLVELYFYSTTLGSYQTKVEKLSFYNHTECECRDKVNGTSIEIIDDSLTLTLKAAGAQKSSAIERCKCPKHFKMISTYYNPCSCDCDEGNVNCLQLKLGNEHFSITDRICISNDKCTKPVCEHGNYVMEQGKCPSLIDKKNEFRRMRINY